LRSTSRRRLAATSGGNAARIIPEVTRLAHAKTGIRASVIPGARDRRTRTMISIAATIAEISTKVTPSNQKSRFRPGENSLVVSGTYAYQPPSGTVPKKKLESSRMAPPR
jgi:hypothetical protein